MRTDEDRSLESLLPPEDEDVLTPRQIAELTHVPLATVYTWLKGGRLQGWRLPNGRWLSTRQALERSLRRSAPLPPRERRLRREASREARSRANRAELRRLGVL